MWDYWVVGVKGVSDDPIVVEVAKTFDEPQPP